MLDKPIVSLTKASLDRQRDQNTTTKYIKTT